MKKLTLNPVNTRYARNLTEMLGVVCHYCQSKMAGGDGYHDVKIANNDTLTGESLSYLSIVMRPVAKR